MSITTFAATEFLHEEADADWAGFAPTQVLALDGRAVGGLPAAPARPRLAADAAALATARWVEEQEAAALAAMERARIARAATAANAANAALAAAARSSTLPLRRGWLSRLESALDRLLPGALGSLLQLFVCVSLTMAMISALLPMVDRL